VLNILNETSYLTKTLVRWFWQNYVRSWLGVLLLGFALMAIEGGALGLLSYMVRPMFDEIFIAGDRGAVFWIAGSVFAIFVARALAGFAQKVMMARVARTVSANIQRDLVDHLVLLDSGFYQKNSPGVLIERVRGDPGAAADIIASTFSAFGRDLIGLISLLSVALYIDWLWTLIAIAGAPLLFFPVLLLQKMIRNTSRSVRNIAAVIATRLDELFHGINTVKLNGTEAYETRRFSTEVKALVNAELKATAASAGIPALMDIVAAIGFLGVLSYGGLQIIEGEKTVGEFMSFFTAFALLFEPMRRLGTLSGAIQTALVSLERIYSVFQLRPEIISPTDPVDLPIAASQADIELRNVSFSYGNQPILADVSFVARAGKTTAIVGASGAGKSTVFNLLTRLIDVNSGNVLIGGCDVRTLDLTNLRALFSVVTQDAQLFDESIKNNILLGTTTSDSKLSSALDTAHVSDFLAEQSDGIDTPAGPRGSALSGGQRQRVAIARALLRDTPILLLDEATSALDAQSEAIVQAALEHLSQGRTTLVIAHRLATVRSADTIIVMDRGRIVDQGTHDALIKRDGIYKNLYRLQFSEDI
ncbi:MAG: ABC transporter ATP-binding protein, partial [Paracoccaceae bacterium]